MLHISEFLDPLLMPMFLSKKGPNLMIEAESLCSLDMMRIPRDTSCFNLEDGKIVIHRVMEFDEHALWVWSSKKDESYDFLPYFEDEKTTIQEV